LYTPRGKRGGTGLGLAVVKRLVTEQGGDVLCHSRKGLTEFIVRLPAVVAVPQNQLFVVLQLNKKRKLRRRQLSSRSLP
jgi:hypothetical protein